MSARDILLPNMALGSVLRNYQNRLMAAERRARFPGAIHQADVTSVGPLPLAPSFVDLVTLNVDHGRWLVGGGFWTDTTSTAADDQILINAQLYYGSTFAPLYQAGQFNVSGGTRDSTAPFWTINVSAPVTLKLRANSNVNFGPSNQSTAFDIWLVAFPG